MRNLSAVILTALLAQHLIDPARGSELTLQECVDMALTRNPLITAANARVLEGRARLGEATAGFFPQVDFSGSAGRSEASYQMVIPAFGGFEGESFTAKLKTDRYDAGVTLRQILWDFGRTAQLVRQGREGIHSAQDAFEEARLRVSFEVKQAYFSLLKAQRLTEVSARNQEQTENHLAMAQARFDHGLGTRAEVVRARAASSEATLGVIQAKHAVEGARWALNRVLGRPLTEELDVADVPSPVVGTQNYDLLLSEAGSKRPELKILRDQIRQAEVSVGLARLEQYPVFMGSASYQRWDDSWPLGQTNWSYGLSLSIPVFDGLRARSRVAAARANLESLRANEEDLKTTVALEIKMALQRRDETGERIQVMDVYVGEAEENLALAEGRYEEGLATQVELIDAQVLLLTARRNHEEAVCDLHLAQAQLDRAVGAW
jgi:outer membrane protein TolC